METGILSKLSKYKERFDFEKVGKALEFVDECEDTTGVLDLILSLYPEQDTVLSVLLMNAYFEREIDDVQVKELFGLDVLNIVLGLKKLRSIKIAKSDKAAQSEVLRKMFMAMAKDIRVIVIDLADRLYRMQNLEKVKDAADRLKFSMETLDLYVPIADRLGIYSIKTELEDLAFCYIHAKEYRIISKELQTLRESCNVSIYHIKEQLDEFFLQKGIEADVSGRIKSVYSIYKKLSKKGFNHVADLYDIFAMRIVLPLNESDNEEALDHIYRVLGMLHGEWRPISKRFKDYLAVPKPNGYKSLHTVVLGLAPDDMDQPVEIQIRDRRMHRDAEYGVASHWLYKEGGSRIEHVQSKVEWLRALERIRDDIGVGAEDLSAKVELDVFKDRIFVLTPQGEVKDLPKGATPIDFAYAVHTDVGHSCMMGKVDGRVVPLDYELKSGEMVEIVTRKGATPKLQWLSIVNTGFARNKIKAWFSALNRETNLKEGRRLLNRQLGKIGKPYLDQKLSILKHYLGKTMNLAMRESLVEEVGKGGKMARDIIRKIYPNERVDDLEVKEFSQSAVEVYENQILVGGEEGLPIKLAACCDPKVGVEIFGYVTRGNRITIHKKSCRLVKNLSSERVVPASWKKVAAVEAAPKYRVELNILVNSRVGLIRDISTVISSFEVDIVDIHIGKDEESGKDRDCFAIELDNMDQLGKILTKLEEVDGVFKIVKSAK